MSIWTAMAARPRPRRCGVRQTSDQRRRQQEDEQFGQETEEASIVQCTPNNNEGSSSSQIRIGLKQTNTIYVWILERIRGAQQLIPMEYMYTHYILQDSQCVTRVPAPMPSPSATAEEGREDDLATQQDDVSLKKTRKPMYSYSDHLLENIRIFNSRALFGNQGGIPFG